MIALSLLPTPDFPLPPPPLLGDGDDAEGALGGAFPPPPPPIEEPFPPAPLEEEIFPSPPPPLEEEGRPEAPIPLPPQVWRPGRGSYIGTPSRESGGSFSLTSPCLSGLMGVGWGWSPGMDALIPEPVAQGEGEQY